MTTTAVRRQSGLQKHIYSLYRSILRQAVFKDKQRTSATNNTFIQLLNDMNTSVCYVQREFRKQSLLVSKRDIKTIEHKIRFGEKQLKMLKDPHVQIVRGKGSDLR